MHTPVHETALDEQIRVLMAVVVANSKIGLGSLDGYTPLHNAAASNRSEVAEVLLKAQANVDPVNHSGDTPLSIAVYHEHEASTQVLLENGAQPNRKLRGMSLLAMASSRPSEHIVQLLLNAGADVDAHDESYGTAIFQASLWGYHTVVAKLLQRAANPGVRDPRGRTPLYQAIMSNHIEVVLVLIAHGANVTDSYQPYSIMFATLPSRVDLAIMDILLDHGVDPNLQDQAGNNVLSVLKRRVENNRIVSDNDYWEAWDAEDSEDKTPSSLDDSDIDGSKDTSSADVVTPRKFKMKSQSIRMKEWENRIWFLESRGAV